MRSPKLTAIYERLVMPSPDIRTLPAIEARLIIAMRVAVMARVHDLDCRERLSERLGSDLAATRMLILAETIGHAWPEPFQIARPCCSQTTPDETMLVAGIRLAASGNRPAYDALTGEMLGACERERIFTDLRHFAAAYIAAASGR